jgi:putative MATE family efflux protein
MQDLTTGSLTRHLLKTTSFVLASMIVQTLYVLIDLYWVGRLGTEAVAAVGISGNVAFVVIGASQMLGVGTTALVSQATGRKDRVAASLVFNQSQVLGMALGMLFLIVAMTGRLSYARRLSADETTARLAADYLRWFIPAMALQFALVAMGSALRGTGNFRPGMIVQIATVLLNIVLAPVLIFGWGTGQPLGVAGAALGTFIAIVVGVVAIVGYFLRSTSYLTFAVTTWKPRLDLWRDVLRIGLPTGAEFAMMATYLVLVYLVIRRFGPAAQAGFGIGVRIIQACLLPAVALGFAVAPVAGQNFGARQAARVRATFARGCLMAALGMLAMTLVVETTARVMVQTFSNDPDVMTIGREYLQIVAWTFMASAVVLVSSSLFQAMGNTVPSLIASFTRLVLVALPLLFLARLPTFDIRWVWYLSVGAVVAHMCVSLLLLRREFRVRLQFEEAAAA